MPASYPPRAQQVPHDEKRDEEVHLAETDRDEHRIEKQSRKGRAPRRAARRRRAEPRLDEPYRDDEQPTSATRLHMRPHGLDRMDGGERPLPRHKEKCREGRVGEQEARVREREGVEVRREDVATAETQVDAKVDFVRPQCDVQAVCERGGESTRGPAPSR